MDGDDGGLPHLRVAHQRIFKIDGTDPLAARLDQILRAIRDTHVALAVDGRDIAGPEPAVGSPLVVPGDGLEITRGDPWPSYLELAHRLTILWTHSIGVDCSNVDERHRQSLP